MNILVIGRGNVGGGLARRWQLVVALTQAGLGPFFYRYAKPGEL